MFHTSRLLAMGRRVARVSALTPCSSLQSSSLSSSLLSTSSVSTSSLLSQQGLLVNRERREWRRIQMFSSSSPSLFDDEEEEQRQEQGSEMFEEIPIDGRLYAHQEELPRLPIPDLKDSCDRYLKSLEPIVSEEMLEQTKALVEDFLEERGPVLQEDLKKLDEENKKGSWLSGYWEDMYLSGRDGHMINVNPFWLLSPFENIKDPIQVLATVIRSTASFHHLTRTQGLSPDKVNGEPLCAHQYGRLFGSASIPNKGKDYYMSTPESNHIVLSVAGRMFFFLVMTPEGDIIPQDLCVKAIKKCIKEAGRMTHEEGDSNPSLLVPLFTAGDRDTWAGVREELSYANSGQMQAVDSAIAVFNFLDIAGDDAVENCATALAPPLGWFDKTQFNVMQNGQVSINMQHAACDGHTLLTFIKHLQGEVDFGVGSGELGRDNGPQARDADFDEFVQHAKPYPLEWDVSMVSQFHEKAQQAQEAFTQETGNLDATLIDFREFGAEWIKSKKVSPDAFMQAAFQLAYYRWTGEVASTYESVLMKKFLRGRTETGRPLTAEMKKFCEVMEDVLIPADKQAEALREASAAHSKQMASCAAGQGFDRHLWVLKHVMDARIQRLDNEEPHPFFFDPSYHILNHHTLSTSTCSVDGVEAFGFGPVVEDGFGVGYAAERERLMVFVSSFLRDTGERTGTFSGHINKALGDLKAILEEEERVRSGAKKEPVKEELKEELKEEVEEEVEESEASEEEVVEIAETEAVGK